MLEGGAMECGAPWEELTDVRAGVDAQDDGAWKGVDARERGVGTCEGGSSVTSLSGKTEVSVCLLSKCQNKDSGGERCAQAL